VKVEEKPKVEKKGLGSFFKSLSDINKNPICKNVFLAGLMRTFGSTIVGAYIPVFFMKTYP